MLVDPLGIKISDRETPDILDIFNRSPDEVRQKSWHDPDRFAPDFNAMSDEALVVYARNREALCLYAWHPYMYNPAAAALARPDQGADLAAVGGERPGRHSGLRPRLQPPHPGSRFELIEAAGHHPEIEQPEAFAERVRRFLEE